MNNAQVNELNMFETSQQFLNTNAIIWSGNPAMVTVIATIISHISGINASQTAQNTSTAGVTLTKETARLNMITAALALANAGKAYASATANQTLYNALNITKSQLTLATDTNVDNLCQALIDNIAPYIASTTAYGATSTTLTNLQNLIYTYSPLIGTPAVQKTIVGYATLTIIQHFTAVNNLFKTQLDPLMAQYQTSHPAFYNQYLLAREINNIGNRHTVILKGFIHNTSNQALPNAIITLSGKANHTKITNATGQYKFTRLHTGTYTLTVSVAGYTTQTHNLTIVQNGTTHTDFAMLPTSSSGVGTGIGTSTL